MATVFVAAVRDSKTEVFSQPMFFVTQGVAVRSFHDECRREGSDVSRHPEDFAFFQLGTYDDFTGKFVNLPQPLQVAHAMDNLSPTAVSR